MKVLFLDLDGVLNNRASLTRSVNLPLSHGWRRVYSIDPGCFARLQQVVQATGCKIVVSSTWRRDPEAMTILREDGVLTPDTELPVPATIASRSGLRGHEIKHWLDHHGAAVTRYAIVDDDSDMLDEQFPYFVRTENEFGLQPDHVERLITILNG